VEVLHRQARGRCQLSKKFLFELIPFARIEHLTQHMELDGFSLHV
jgi:hypothetical protein